MGVILTACGGTQNAQVTLPKDDAPHVNTRIEWWYYNGHLDTAQGNHYAFHYAVFQVLVQDVPVTDMAHLAISDPQSNIYSTDQRMSPASSVTDDRPGFAFNLGGWEMLGYDGHDKLSAYTRDYALDLTIDQEKPPVLHQQTGLVSFGNSGESHYYSRTRLAISGNISILGTKTPVTGLAWFDLQLSDGSDVMLEVGRQPVYHFGTFVAPDGTASPLKGNEFKISSTDSWTSPASGAVYPLVWEISIPDRGIDVTVTPVIRQCEFNAVATTQNYYWEGEVVVSGSHSGRGFVELTAYTPK